MCLVTHQQTNQRNSHKASTHTNEPAQWHKGSCGTKAHQQAPCKDQTYTHFEPLVISTFLLCRQTHRDRSEISLSHGHTCPLAATSPFQRESCAFTFSRSRPTSTTKHSSGRTPSPGDPQPVFSLPKQLSDHQITSDYFRYI